MNTTASPEHIVKSFDGELARLTGEIVAMGELAAIQLARAMDALRRRDAAAAHAVIDGDDGIDAQERRIGEDVLRLLALRQPLARDLREVLAALRIAADIERIGDYAVGIAKRSLLLDAPAPAPLIDGLTLLADSACAMLRAVLAAYCQRDAVVARAVWQRDDELDARYMALFRELLTHMLEDATSIAACTHLLSIAKQLERTGDHATNIAEDVWFAVYGEPLRPASPAA